jgi:hypothetical protein
LAVERGDVWPDSFQAWFVQAAQNAALDGNIK